MILDYLEQAEFNEKVPALARKLGIETIEEWQIVENALPYEIDIAEHLIAADCGFPSDDNDFDSQDYVGEVDKLLKVYNAFKKQDVGE
jgi:hypothetical protein